jgi:hypothetical protein
VGWGEIEPGLVRPVPDGDGAMGEAERREGGRQRRQSRGPRQSRREEVGESGERGKGRVEYRRDPGRRGWESGGWKVESGEGKRRRVFRLSDPEPALIDRPKPIRGRCPPG